MLKRKLSANASDGFASKRSLKSPDNLLNICRSYLYDVTWADVNALIMWWFVMSGYKDPDGEALSDITLLAYTKYKLENDFNLGPMFWDAIYPGVLSGSLLMAAAHGRSFTEARYGIVSDIDVFVSDDDMTTVFSKLKKYLYISDTPCSPGSLIKKGSGYTTYHDYNNALQRTVHSYRIYIQGNYNCTVINLTSARLDPNETLFDYIKASVDFSFLANTTDGATIQIGDRKALVTLTSNYNYSTQPVDHIRTYNRCMKYFERGATIPNIMESNNPVQTAVLMNCFKRHVSLE